MIDISIKATCNIVKLHAYNVIYFTYTNFEFKKNDVCNRWKNWILDNTSEQKRKKSTVTYKQFIVYKCWTFSRKSKGLIIHVHLCMETSATNFVFIKKIYFISFFFTVWASWHSENDLIANIWVFLIEKKRCCFKFEQVY